MRNLQLTDEQYREHQARIAKFRKEGRVRIVLDGKTVAPKVPKPRFSGSKLERSMALQIHLSDLPKPIQQFRAIPTRKFRLDFGWPDLKIGLECDGQVHRIKGRFEGSFERGAVLLLAGWKILHVGSKEVSNGRALKWLTELLKLVSKG